MAEELTFHLEDFDGPLELLLALVAKHKMDLHNIPILELIDQYPRTVAQAEALNAMLKRFHREISAVIMINLPESEVVSRITSRRQCKKCGAILHVNPEAPLAECPSCGGELYTRADDTAEHVKRRLEVYHNDTPPVKNYYLNSGKYVEIKGNQTPEKVFEDIVNVIKKAK